VRGTHIDNKTNAETAAENIRRAIRSCMTELPAPTGESAAFGNWRLTDIVRDTLERFREVRRAKGTGVVGTNRHLGTLRAMAQGIGTACACRASTDSGGLNSLRSTSQREYLVAVFRDRRDKRQVIRARDRRDRPDSFDWLPARYRPLADELGRVPRSC